MRDGKVNFDGLNLVETIHDNKFVEYVEELENERLSSQEDLDDEEIYSEDEGDTIDNSGNSYLFDKDCESVLILLHFGFRS